MNKAEHQHKDAIAHREKAEKNVAVNHPRRIILLKYADT